MTNFCIGVVDEGGHLGQHQPAMYKADIYQNGHGVLHAAVLFATILADSPRNRFPNLYDSSQSI